MALFIPKGKVPGRTFSMVLDTGTATYVDGTTHIAEWNTPLGCIQKESICILEHFAVDTNGPAAVFSNIYCVRLLNGAGSPYSYDSTKNQPDNVLVVDGIPYARAAAGAVGDGMCIASGPITVLPKSRNGVICGAGFNLQRIRIALEEYDAVNGPYASQISRIVYHLVWIELENDD